MEADKKGTIFFTFCNNQLLTYEIALINSHAPQDSPGNSKAPRTNTIDEGSKKVLTSFLFCLFLDEKRFTNFGKIKRKVFDSNFCFEENLMNWIWNIHELEKLQWNFLLKLFWLWESVKISFLRSARMFDKFHNLLFNFWKKRQLDRKTWKNFPVIPIILSFSEAFHNSTGAQ